MKSVVVFIFSFFVFVGGIYAGGGVEARRQIDKTNFSAVPKNGQSELLFSMANGSSAYIYVNGQPAAQCFPPNSNQEKVIVNNGQNTIEFIAVRGSANESGDFLRNVEVGRKTMLYTSNSDSTVITFSINYDSSGTVVIDTEVTSVQPLNRPLNQAMPFNSAQNNALPGLAVVEFTGDATDDTGLVRRMVESVMADSGNYTIVSSYDIYQIIAQQELARRFSNLDSNTIDKLKRAKVNYIVTGTVDKRGIEGFISLKMLDVSNAILVPNSPRGVVHMAPMDSLYNDVSNILKDFLSRMKSEGGTVVRKVSPPAPQNVRTGTPGTDSVQLSWNNAGDGISYQIYYSTSNNPQQAQAVSNRTTGASTTLSNLSAGTTYYFWVTSLRDGLESEKSTAATVQTVLPPPQNVWGTMGTNSVSLSWRPIVGDGIRYQVYYSTTNNPERAQPGGSRVTGASTTISNLSAGTTYYFWVTSLVEKLESEKSTAVTVKTAPIVYKIGDRGPGGGYVFSVTDGVYSECSSIDLGNADYDTAIRIAKNYRGGGFNNWELPLGLQLIQMYSNLKTAGLGNFANDYYWSSSWSSLPDIKQAVHFRSGVMDPVERGSSYRIRAVRLFR